MIALLIIFVHLRPRVTTHVHVLLLQPPEPLTDNDAKESQLSVLFRDVTVNQACSQKFATGELHLIYWRPFFIYSECPLYSVSQKSSTPNDDSVTARFLRLVPRHGTVCHLRCVANLCPCSVLNTL